MMDGLVVDTVTVRLVFEKETKNTIRFASESKPGEPPVVTTLYLPKWWIGQTKAIKVTVEKEK